MKIECNQKNLRDALNAVVKSGASRTTMQILEGVLLEASNGILKLTTNDLETGREYTMECNVIEEGKTVVDKKMFSMIVEKLVGDISLEVNNNLFTIKAMGSVYNLATMNASEYPRLPFFNVESSVTLPQGIFKDLIRKTSFAVSQDENRPVYTGELVKIENNILTIVAIDGFRLALKKYLLEKETNDFKAIVPGKVLNEIVSHLKDDDSEITIGINKNKAIFEIGKCIVVSRLIDGEFLNYSNIIPSEKETSVEVRTKDLLEAFDRVALFSRTSIEKDKKASVKLTINLDGVTLSCNAQTGDAKEQVNAVVNGKELEIGFNPNYVIEALKCIEDETIRLNFLSNISPVTINPMNGNEYIYIVLPVRGR